MSILKLQIIEVTLPNKHTDGKVAKKTAEKTR